MNIEELHSFEPFWNYWYIDDLLGEGSFGKVYRIKREEFQSVQYAALKIISIPQSEAETAQLESAGMTREEIQAYYYEIVQEIYHEVTLMAELKGKSNIVSYEDHEIKEHQQGVGYDILIRMELVESLTEYSKFHSFHSQEVIRMGKELCQSLMVCEKHNILHRDIKPDNIFVSKDGDYKLGDFGIARTAEQKCQVGLSVKGSYEYMAPEVYAGKEYDQRVDIYSLGIVLYTFLNNKQIPFINQEQTRVTYQQRQTALKMRLSGEEVSLPSQASEKLGEVVRKAIAFEPENRYSNAEEFFYALSEVEKSEKEEMPLRTDLEQTVVLHTSPGLTYFGENENKEEKNQIIKEQVEKIESAFVRGPEQEEDNNNLEKENRNSKKQRVPLRMAVCFAVGIFSAVMLYGGVSLREQKDSKNIVVEKRNTVSLAKEKKAENISTPTPTEISEADLQEIDLTGKGISSLNDSKQWNKVEQKELLGSVCAGENSLESIELLAKAKNIHTLDLHENNITDVSVLGELKMLRMINLTGNPVSDISWVSGHNKLESLWIGDTDIVDLSNLEGVEKLVDLHLENTNVRDLTGLEQCISLTQIDLTGAGKLTSIQPLLSLKHLSYVSLHGTKVSKEQVHELYIWGKKRSKDFYLIAPSGEEYAE